MHLFFLLAAVTLCYGRKSTVTPGTVIATLFDDGFAPKGYGYSYGGRTSFETPSDGSKKDGSVLALHFDDREVSAGIGVGIDSKKAVDCSTILEHAALRFRVKGAAGNEWFRIGIIDNGEDDSNKVTVYCRSRDWFIVGREWQTVSIPLRAFLRGGMRWYDRKHTVEAAEINWRTVSAVSFSTEKEYNFGFSGDQRIATVFLDDIELVDIAPVDMSKPLFNSWGLQECAKDFPVRSRFDSTIVFSWLSDRIAPFTALYVYGAPTDFRLCSADTKEGLTVLDTWFNDNEWSGVSFFRSDADAVDLRAIRETGSLIFRVRGVQGGKFNIGILDDASDGVDRNVQTKVSSEPYCSAESTWQEVVIPLADFTDFGKWWHSDAHYEVNGKVDWSKIVQLRFSTDKNANAEATENGEHPLRLQFADVRFSASCTAFSRSVYWKNFSSTAADRTVDDFNSGSAESGWTCRADTHSTMTLATAVNSIDGTPALAVTHSLAEWGTVNRNFTDPDFTRSDWSEHAALKLDICAKEHRQECGLMLIDSGSEAWYTTFTAGMKWETVVLPFARFKPFEWWQPDSAIQNRKMDLGRVRQYMLCPELKGNSAVVMADNVTLTNKLPPDAQAGTSLFVNQIGYERTQPKRFLCRADSPQPFALFDSHGTMVFSAKADDGGFFPLAGAEYRSGYFSEVRQNGTYSLVLQESGEKQDVVIGENIFSKPLTASLKAFYFQRSGCAIEPEYAGKWARACGHSDTSCAFHGSTGKEGHGDVHGGWYDAGDYGKYVVPAGITVSTLLALYELYPQCTGDSIGIPESGNGISDLLDEARYEIEWMRRMQDSDGGVYFKVGTLSWDGFTMPDATTGERYIIGKSTASTLEFTAVLAMAARLFKDADRRFASQCLKSATAAWKWAVAHPAVGEPKESGGTGAYGDGRFDDEFFHAASELYCTTHKSISRKFIEANASLNQVKGPAGWNDVGNLGVFSLCRNNPKIKSLDVLRQSLIAQADQSAEAIEKHPCRIPTEQFIWGSNSYMLNHAVILCYAHLLTRKQRYLERVQDVVDYIFGVNPAGYSFVTGFGKQSPKHPHHRIMGADTVDEPFPGFLVGGPNGGREDEVRNAPGVYYSHKEPALAYVDFEGAYACNEVAINWNAPLVFVLGYLKEAIKD